MSTLSKPQSAFDMPLGAEVRPDGVRFRIWAPDVESVHLLLEESDESLPMIRDDAGWFELTTNAAQVGSRYRYELPNGMKVPDPASRFQPEDVDGASEVIDPSEYVWHTRTWKGCAWEQVVLYELHIGTFTPEGTFLAAIDKLDDLVQLGITAIEIMPVADFPGDRNWGYDGVLLYAPDSTYGRPEHLKELVDAAHARGLMVILDVVYNHFGPEGNYIGQYFRDIVSRQYETPWGQALNFDARHGSRTREFIVQNALYWINEFRMDGLRLDAVHAVVDNSSVHILDELAAAVRREAGGREVHLILESDDRVWHHLLRGEFLKPVSSTAQWNHDMQKLVSLALASSQTAEDDLRDTTLLGVALTVGFTSGRHHRNAPEHAEELPASPGGFISFLQTHDTVGNRMCGERITDLAPAHIVRAIAAVYLLAPQIPMLLMGEEWGASSPFPYFCDLKGELGQAVRKGRLEQFATPAQRQDAKYLASVPDPLSEKTFLEAKLRWAELAAHPHAHWLAWYRSVLRKRRELVIPLLSRLHATRGSFDVLGPRLLRVSWHLNDAELLLEANLSDAASALFELRPAGMFWLEGSEAAAGGLGPWTVRWSLKKR